MYSGNSPKLSFGWLRNENLLIEAGPLGSIVDPLGQGESIHLCGTTFRDVLA